MFVIILMPYLLFKLASGISNYPILIVVSFDAFRWDFVGKKTPNLWKLRSKGTYADYMNNVFPTKTFPNHHSIATGLYTEVHGVVANSFFDPAEDQIIHYSEEMFHYNEDIIPIWIHNEKAAEDRYSGIMMWPGGSFSYDYTYPEYTKEFEPDYSWELRIDDIISWITDPHKPANLIMLYIEEPDSHAHAFGPESPVVLQMIHKLDHLVDTLMSRLDGELKDKVNVIFLSDHGVSSVSPPHFIDITKELEPHTYEIAASSPALHILPHEGYEEEIYLRLKKLSKKTGHFKVFRKHELLKRWFFKNNPRTPPILVLAEDGYGFQDLAVAADFYSKKYHFPVTNKTKFGTHGYDNINKNMKPFFLALGPKIKQNHKVAPFNTVDLFSLFCEILELKHIPTNGSFTNIEDILFTETTWVHALPKIIIVAGAIFTSLIFIMAAIAIIIIRWRQKITTTAALGKRFPHTVQTSFAPEAQHLLNEDA